MGVPTGATPLLHGVCTTPSPTTGSTIPFGETNTPGPLASTAGHAGLGAVVVVVVVVDSVVVVVSDFDAVEPCTAVGLLSPPPHATSATTIAATTAPLNNPRLGVVPRRARKDAQTSEISTARLWWIRGA